MPFWLRLLGDVRIVICVRHPAEVAESFAARDEMPHERAAELWLAYYRTLLESAPEERSVVTHYDSFFTDPVGEQQRLVELLGFDPTPVQRARANEIVNAGLRHHVARDRATARSFPPEVWSCYEDLRARAVGPKTGREAGSDPAAELQATRELLSESRQRVYALQDELAAQTRERDEFWLQTQKLDEPPADFRARSFRYTAALRRLARRLKVPRPPSARSKSPDRGLGDRRVDDV